jgi:hypothetical protein
MAPYVGKITPLTKTHTTRLEGIQGEWFEWTHVLSQMNRDMRTTLIKNALYYIRPTPTNPHVRNCLRTQTSKRTNVSRMADLVPAKEEGSR